MTVLAATYLVCWVVLFALGLEGGHRGATFRATAMVAAIAGIALSIVTLVG